LIKKLTSSTQDIMVYVHLDEIFHILNAVHQTVGHGGIRKTLIEVKRLYENITFPCVRVFIDLCDHCNKKSKGRNSKSQLPGLNTSGLSASKESLNQQQTVCNDISHTVDEVIRQSLLTAELSMAENSVDSSTGSTSAHSLVSNDSGVSSVSSSSSGGKRKVNESGSELPADQATGKRKCGKSTNRSFTHSASSSVTSSVHQTVSVDISENEDYDDNDATCKINIFLTFHIVEK
jgi:hypothetical protein